MLESQNRKRAPARTEREVLDLIAVWGEESVLSELRSSFQNAKTFVKISQGMKDRRHNRDPKQCRVKLKKLRQTYQKTREANSRSGSEPQTCRFYDELHAILGGSTTTTPTVCFDCINGEGGHMGADFGDEEDDDDEVVDSSQQASGETGFPDSQELFLTLDLEPAPSKPTQGCLLDPPGGEGTSGEQKLIDQSCKLLNVPELFRGYFNASSSIPREESQKILVLLCVAAGTLSIMQPSNECGKGEEHQSY
ncbi:hypothetical protein UY3_00291 [Chelonia mydas]|uniref:Myb/SANT-like DNA-binding domain-containing protein n=1 Tax=Chelonia mydas TaxID=8469 RepID=M7CMJ5_CHEMY|nr:hypothetical protein UY3_00291 [Chelonia mydas]